MTTQNIQIIQAIEILKNGGVISTPSESSYGLSCLITSKEAINKIFSLKQRQSNKGLILIGYSWSLFKNIVELDEIPKNNINIMLKSWPGAITWIIPLKSSTINIFPEAKDSIAVRITNHPILYELSKLLDIPLVSTSANISNKPPAKTNVEVEIYFQDKIDYIIESEETCCRKPTPIYDLRTLKKIR